VTRVITGGVDTHADVHVAAALDPVGGLLGVQEFPATTAGYSRLLGWLGGFGTVCLVGIEGTGSYGAGLARHVTAAGVRVAGVDRSDRQDRRRQGKSGPLGAVSAARAAQSGRARGAPKGRDGTVEAVRVLMVAKRSACSGRTQTINQARALVLTGPDDLRARFARHTPASLVTELASLRPRPGDVVGYATRIALRELGRRAEFLGGQLGRPGELIVPLVTAHAPGLLALYGIGPSTAALLRITPNGCAARPPGRTCAPPRPSRLHQARPSATGSTPAATARPTTPYGGSCSPAWALTWPPAPTSSAAQQKEVQGRDHPLPQALRRPRGLPPPLHHRRLTHLHRGRPDPIIGCRIRAGLRTIRRPSPGHH
jgi:transposase